MVSPIKLLMFLALFFFFILCPCSEQRRCKEMHRRIKQLLYIYRKL